MSETQSISHLHRVRLYYIDNPTYRSSWYDRFKNARICTHAFQLDEEKEKELNALWKVFLDDEKTEDKENLPLKMKELLSQMYGFSPDGHALTDITDFFRKVKEEKGEEYLKKLQDVLRTQCDHGGLVLGSVLNSAGYDVPIDLYLIEKRHDNNIVADSGSKSYAVGNMLGEYGYYLAEKILVEQEKTSSPIDMVCQSYVWAQSLEGLADEEIDKHGFFYAFAKSQQFQTLAEELDADKKEILLNVLKSWYNELTHQKQVPNEDGSMPDLKDVIRRDVMQEKRQDLFKRYAEFSDLSAQACERETNKEKKEKLASFKDFCDCSCGLLNGLKKDDTGKLVCETTLDKGVQAYLKVYPLVQHEQRLISKFDALNIGVFTANSLQKYYKCFMHGAMSVHKDGPLIPLARQDDGRVALLEPQDTILFQNQLKHQPVPSSYKKIDLNNMNEETIEQEGFGGVSGLIPQMAGLFAIARSIDPDIRQQEFSELVKRSGDLALTVRDKAVFGGIIPDKNKLSQIVRSWKTMRTDEKIDTKWRNADKDMRKERETAFSSFLADIEKNYTAQVIKYRLKENVPNESSSYCLAENYVSSVVAEKVPYTAFSEIVAQVKSEAVQKNEKNKPMKPMQPVVGNGLGGRD